MKDQPAEVPDTFGLPEYRISKIIKQRVGDDIYFLCGSESFGQTHWLYVAVMKASDVLTESMESIDLARDAFADNSMRIRFVAH